MATFTFDEKKVRVIQLALENLIRILDGESDISPQMRETISKITKEEMAELFASIHSQGG
jgi:hypothetical protein